MSKLFLISGLGADERLFKNLDLSGFEVVPVTWIEPEKQDTLTTYATKLIYQFGIEAGASIIGVSLGGMLTVEIAKQVQLQHAIIISSIKSKTEAPWYFAFFRNVPVYKLLSGGFVQKMGPIVRPLFGKFTGSKETPMFFSMLKNSNPIFLKWAMGAALHWNGEPAPYKINHIVGDTDLIFNHKLISNAIVIPKGDHVMVYSRAKEISPIIRNILNG
ncbi:MAG: alpha/beta hydrolase [Mucilaginibacter sp.]|uniref:alpha/beta hydrolase n=1 Tax=Mucilaginibacter sp. TaxID=1882438 RepID=UPI003263C5E9